MVHGKHRVIELVAQCYQFTLAEQQVVDGIFNFQNINFYQQIGEHFVQVGNRGRLRCSVPSQF